MGGAFPSRRRYHHRCDQRHCRHRERLYRRARYGRRILHKLQEKHGPFPDTLTIEAGGRQGFHRHFLHPGYPVRTCANPDTIKVDVRADGGFAVLPPTLHKSGNRYRIVGDTLTVAPLPEWLIDALDIKLESRSRGPFIPAPARPLNSFEGSLLIAALKIIPVTGIPVELRPYLPDRKSYFESYGMWSTAGGGIKTSFGDIAFPYFDRWSSLDPDRYEGTAATYAKWRKLKYNRVDVHAVYQLAARINKARKALALGIAPGMEAAE
jgi:Bifunctional DNA primase/polymerase, N-terminal